MNPVFWILVLLITIAVWALTRPLWEPFGEWILRRANKINETLYENDSDIKEEKGR